MSLSRSSPSIKRPMPRSLITLLLTSTAYSHTCLASEAAEHKLDEVIVTSLPFKASVEDAIQPVEVISAADLPQQLGSSIGETLAKQPGITATYFGPNASRPIIRGLSGERVQMLQDSLSSLDVSSLSEDHAVSIEDALATQIEIVKGPASLLYGSGAVGGVVNVLTDRLPSRAPTTPVSGVASLRWDGANDARSGVGAVDLGSDRVAVHLDGYRKQSGDVRVPNSAFSAQTTAELLSNDPNAFIPSGRIYHSGSDSHGGAAGVSLFGERGYVGASLSGFSTRYDIPLAPGDDPSSGGTAIDMQQKRIDVAGQWQGGDGWFKQVRFGAARNDYTHSELEPDGAVGTRFNQIGSEVRMAIDHQFGAWQGSLGLQHKHLDFAALGDERFVPPSVTDNLGVFIFEQLPLDRFTLQTGARIEQQRITPEAASGLPRYRDSAFSASLGGLWKVSELQSLALNVTHSARHPTATELYADGPHEATGQFVIGNPDLRQETANSIDLIWRGGDRLHWHLSTYLNDFQHYLYLAPTAASADGLPVFEYRQSKARYLGAEAALRWHAFEQGARHLDIELSSDVVRATLADGTPVPQIPPFRVGTLVEWVNGAWQTNLSAFRYSSQQRIATYETPTAGYTMVDAELGYHWLTTAGDLLLFLKGSNLTDAQARRHTSPLKEYAPLPGRAATLGATLKF